MPSLKSTSAFRRPRTLPRYFGGDHVRLFGLNILYHQIIVVIAAIVVAVGLRLFLFRTRIGVALRAVVDAPDPHVDLVDAVGHGGTSRRTGGGLSPPRPPAGGRAR